MDRNQRKIIENSIATWGIDVSVREAMSNLAELTYQVNQYYHHPLQSQRDAILTISEKVADVEISLYKILRVIGDSKYKNLINAKNNSQTTSLPTDMMCDCSKLITSLNEYFFKRGKDLDEITHDCVDVGLICNYIRTCIGDTDVDKQLTYRTIKLEKEINDYQSNNNEDNKQ